MVHTNWKAIEDGINPFDHSSQLYTTVMNTHALIEAMKKYEFDAALAADGATRRRAVRKSESIPSATHFINGIQESTARAMELVQRQAEPR